LGTGGMTGRESEGPIAGYEMQLDLQGVVGPAWVRE
jgi:hypothetical protein